MSRDCHDGKRLRVAKRWRNCDLIKVKREIKERKRENV